MRTFMAIETPSEVAHLVSDFQEALRGVGFYGSWPKRENIHMTLFFFGEIDVRKAAKISGIMDDEVTKFKSFWITLDKVGFFPLRGLPRVVWLGTNRGDDVKELYKRLNLSLKEKGFNFPRDFIPHVTVGRVKGIPRSWKEKALSFEIKPVRFKCETVALFSSRLTPKGSIYRVVHRSTLGGLEDEGR